MMRKFLAGVVFGFLLSVMLIPPYGRAQQPAKPADQTMTVLYDPKALEALQRSGGLRVVWWKSGDKFVSLGQPRWIVPGKVKPAISGDSVGAEYYFFDPVTGVLSSQDRLLGTGTKGTMSIIPR
jgi:hypothetical protein